MKVADLQGALLDYWVARAAGIMWWIERSSIDWEVCADTGNAASDRYSPSTDWTQGGPIIERERLEIRRDNHGWTALGNGCYGDGPTILIAAMRAYVASRFGDEVEDTQPGSAG